VCVCEREKEKEKKEKLNKEVWDLEKFEELGRQERAGRRRNSNSEREREKKYARLTMRIKN